MKINQIVKHNTRISEDSHVFMRTACSLGSLLSIPEILECCDAISKTNVDSIWIPETWGMENLSMLAAISAKTATTSVNIGSSIINIFSRSPSSIAMGAATVDTLSHGRLILGLGTSSVPIVEDFHGYSFDKPLQRMREYVQIIRLMLTGQPVNYTNDTFNLKGFKLLIKPPRTSIPIYLAAINKKMVNLAWELGDGVIFYLRPLHELKQTISYMQSKRHIDVTSQIITCVSDDSELARIRARKILAFYVSVGKVYRDFLAQNGFAQETAHIFDEFKKTSFKHNYKFVTDAMLDSLTISGTPSHCKKQLAKFLDCGIALPILQFNPVVDNTSNNTSNNNSNNNSTIKSFELFQGTFFDTS